MADREKIRAGLHRLLGEWFAEGVDGESPGDRYPLGVPTYGAEEVTAALDVLLSDRLTMGPKVEAFERAFAARIGAKHAVMVNSGSSANLLAFSVLSSSLLERPLQRGDEVIVPALTWPTTVSPLTLLGLVPVFVDIDPTTLCLDPVSVKAAITKKTRAILPIHVLGNAARVDELQIVAKEHGLLLIEDCCEALGTELDGKVAGTFGDAGTYSFFYSHHLNTIEGGMLVTGSDEIADLARVMRTYGWARPSASYDALAARNPEIDARFLFMAVGFNFRPTEIQAAFGIEQLAKLDAFNDARRRNAALWSERLAKYPKFIKLTRPAEGCLHTWFYYPFLVAEGAPFTREHLSEHLESKGIETRTILTGNFVKQPAAEQLHYRVGGELPITESVMRRGIMFGNSGGLSQERAAQMADILCEFLDRQG